MPPEVFVSACGSSRMDRICQLAPDESAMWFVASKPETSIGMLWAPVRETNPYLVLLTYWLP